MSKGTHELESAAWAVLESSAKSFGFVATAQDKDNYARLWSRDSAITALAVLAGEREDLYPTVYKSIVNLLEAVGVAVYFLRTLVSQTNSKRPAPAMAVP